MGSLAQPIVPPQGAPPASLHSDAPRPLQAFTVRKPPIYHKWNLIPCLLMAAYLASGVWYFWKRIEVMLAGCTSYQIYFLVLEFIGVSAFLPYAMLLMRGRYPTGSPGLPPAPKDADGKPIWDPSVPPRMHVRVMIPCYKEPMEVVTATISAALAADLPEGVKRTIYLCDDGKSPEKKEFVESLGDAAVYVSGRVRKTGEINGKSANLNNALKNVIYKDFPKDPQTGEIDWRHVSNDELLVVFDADMCADKDFFLKILEVMVDPTIALCLTPQAFHNIEADVDIFNNINSQFWEYWLPGAFGWGYIACTGTNFCLRVRCLCHCGWFPEYTITEDYALGMEMKSRHYEATYLAQYIARGEAPDEVRNVFRQRSRWTKGHFQVFWSRHNPLLNFDLPFFQRLLYAYATWSPFCTTITVPGFMLAPLISVVWGLHPLVITYDFVLTSTVYFIVQCCIQFYVTKFSDLKLMWFVQQSNVILWFTYTKAFINATMAALGLKTVVFKATDKVVKVAEAVASVAQRKPAEPKLLPDNAQSSSYPDGPDGPDTDPEQDDAENTAYLHNKPNHGAESNIKPPRPPKGGLARTSMNGAGEGSVGSGRRMSNSGMPQTMNNGYQYTGVRRASNTGSVYDGMDHNTRRPSYNGASMGGRAPDGYMPVPRLPQSRNESMDGSMPIIPNPLATGRLDVRRMDAPRLPEDETLVMSPARTGDLPLRTGEASNVTIVMSATRSSDPLTDAAAPEAPRSGPRSNLSSVLYGDATSSEGSLSPTHARTAAVTMGHHTGSYVDMHHLGEPLVSPSYTRHDNPAVHGTPAYSNMSMASSFQERPAAPAGLHYDDQHFHAPYDAPPTRANRRSLPGFEMPPLPPQRVSIPGYAQPMPAPYADNSMGSIPAVGPYGMVQMVPTGQYMMMPQMAIPPGYRLSYAGFDPAEEKTKLLAHDDEYSHENKKLFSPGDEHDDRIDEDKPSHENKSSTSKERFMKLLYSFKPQNVSDFGKMFDPLALLVMWMLNMTIVALGLWQLIILFNTPTVAEFKFKSPFKGNPYLLIAILWALTNSVAPYMFLHYCFTSGPSFRSLTKYLPFFSSTCMLMGVLILWLMIPADVPLQSAVNLSVNAFLPNQVAADTNTNYQFVTGVNATAISLSALMLRKPGDPLPVLSDADQLLQSTELSGQAINLLGGLLAGLDHTKSVMPTAHTITWLIWGALQFRSGYNAQQLNQLQSVVKSGADYLMRCNLNLEDPANPIFVAQLGDPADYAVIDKIGYDPASLGKIWTAPSQDPQLAGDAPRKAWVLTRETIGADLLASAAGALAAASLFLREADPTWSKAALAHARYLHNFATIDLTNPQSYCQYVPCSTEVLVSEQVKALPIKTPDGNPLCYWVDWVTATCRIELTERGCDDRRRKVNEVFTTKSACCSYLSGLNAWSGTFTKAQGICALPDDQWQCYMPDLAQRTCYERQINQTTGVGCSGKAAEVFASSLSCCNWLNNQGSSDPASSKTPMGLCSRAGTDANFKICYIPNMVNGTCDEGTGAQCTQYGIITSYDQPVGCCNALALMMKSTAFVSVESSTQTTVVRLRGICSPYVGLDPTTSPSPSPAPGGGGRRLQELPDAGQDDTPFKLRKRSLLQTDATASSTTTLKPGDPGYIDNTTLWPLSTDPKFFEDPCSPKDLKTGQDVAKCIMYQVKRPYNVTFFNSSTILDDLAWSAIWMYKATNEARFLGQAQHFLDQHYQSEATDELMHSTRDIYLSDWNNQAWATNVMLAELTDAKPYHDRIRAYLNLWLFGDAIPSKPQAGLPEEIILNGRQYDNFTVPSTHAGVPDQTYAIIPECTPFKTFESFCFDKQDDDCNGLVDREDPACGLFPVIYSPQQMAWSAAPSLPHAANTAFIALAYSNIAAGNTPQKLRCWALSQLGHILGAGSDERSYVVGFGKMSPDMVQHRASSCPKSGGANTDLVSNYFNSTDTEEDVCDWTSGFYPSQPNPQLNLIAGAMVSGPDRYDHAENRRTSDDMRVALHDNAGFLSALVGLAATETNIRSCESLNGVWQRYAGPNKYV